MTRSLPQGNVPSRPDDGLGQNKAPVFQGMLPDLFPDLPQGLFQGPLQRLFQGLLQDRYQSLFEVKVAR